MTHLAPTDATDRDWIVAVHLAHYTRVERFDATFGDAVARAYDGYLARRDRPDTRGWIAWRGGTRQGSILCVPSAEPGVAQLRLFFVTGGARGQGVGTRLLRCCRDFACAAAYRRLRLWTHAEHRAARARYTALGFGRESARPVRSYGRDLTEEVWSLPLANGSALS